MEIKIEVDRVQELSDQIESLVGKVVYVGIPQENDAREGSPIGNAALGYLFETGSTITNMPPRPWLKPGMMESYPKWMPFLHNAASAAVSLVLAMTGSNEREVDNNLRKAGEAAVAGVQKHIRNKIPPPLKPATIAARYRRHPSRKAGRPLPGETRMAAAARAAGRQVMVNGKPSLVDSDVTPLIDEGNWIASITYIIEKKFTNK